MIPKKDVFSSFPPSSSLAKTVDDRPTKNTPKKITASEIIWCLYYGFFRKTLAIPATISTMTPLIIWYTLAAHIVSATKLIVDPNTSKVAGMASQSGLMFVLSWSFSASLVPGDAITSLSYFFILL